MATITTINASDLITNSRTTINTNFANLNSDKIETSYLDTDTALAANSDVKIPSQKAVKAYIDALGGLTNLVPVGTVLPFAGSATPTYYLACDGTAVSRSTYATLFAAIGTTFGIGNGSTTFNLPDSRGRVIVGSGTGAKVATFASRSGNVITVTGLTDAANNEFQTGQVVMYATTGSVITGLTDDTNYYVVRVTNTTFSLATSLANAQNGTVIALSSDGTGTQTFTLSLTARTRGDTGGEENHAMSSTELLAHTHAPGQGTEFVATGNNGEAGTDSSNDQSTHATTASTGGNAAMNIMQPFLGMPCIIKY